MNDIDYIKRRMKARKHKPLNDHHFKRFYGFMMKVMVSVMLCVGVMTYVKVWPNEKVLKSFMSENLNFNTWFASVGSYFAPFFKAKTNDMPVSKTVNYQWIEKNEYKSGSNQVDILCEGTVIFKGNQKLLNDYVTIQGINGLKITYGNVQDLSVNLYDYVHIGDVIGVYNEKVYLIFEYENKEITYDEAKHYF